MTLDVQGAAAPPRRNGELVFEAPWEGRAFGVAVALADRGLFAWDDFRARLVDELAARPERRYYEAWLVSLESLLAERGILATAAVNDRAADLAHEHDH